MGSGLLTVCKAPSEGLLMSNFLSHKRWVQMVIYLNRPQHNHLVLVEEVYGFDILVGQLWPLRPLSLPCFHSLRPSSMTTQHVPGYASLARQVTKQQKNMYIYPIGNLRLHNPFDLIELSSVYSLPYVSAL